MRKEIKIFVESNRILKEMEISCKLKFNFSDVSENELKPVKEIQMRIVEEIQLELDSIVDKYFPSTCFLSEVENF